MALLPRFKSSVPPDIPPASSRSIPQGWDHARAISRGHWGVSAVLKPSRAQAGILSLEALNNDRELEEKKQSHSAVAVPDTLRAFYDQTLPPVSTAISPIIDLQEQRHSRNIEFARLPIFQGLRTEFGIRRMKQILQNTLSPQERVKIKEAVNALQEDRELVLGIQKAFKGVRADWQLAQHSFHSSTNIRLYVGINLVGIFIAATLWYFPVPKMFLVALVASLLPFCLLADIRGVFLKYKTVFRAADRLAAPLQKSGSQPLREIGRTLASVREKAHPLGLSGINRSLFWLQPVGAIFLLDLLYGHSAKSLWWLSWRLDQKRESLARLLEALGELDVYLVLAENPPNKR